MMTLEQIDEMILEAASGEDPFECGDTDIHQILFLARRGLATMPKPIEEAVIGERYLFYSNGKFQMDDVWCAAWEKHTASWEMPFTECVPLSALDVIP